MSEAKRCPHCEVIKHLEEFNRDKRRADGRYPICKVCYRVYMRSRYKPKPSRSPSGVPVGHKWCSKCDHIKPHDEFYKNKGKKSGLHSYCKSCNAERLDKYRQENAEQISARQAARRASNPEQARERDRDNYQKNQENIRARARAKRAEDVEAAREREREWRQKNPDVHRKAALKYRKNNLEQVRALDRARQAERRVADPERHKEIARRYRKKNRAKLLVKYRENNARRKGATGSHTAEELWLMRECQNHLCAYCETPIFDVFHVDHMMPLSRGGTNDWTNLAITCPTCNLRKNARTAEEFVEKVSA